ncbi:hypothetical protein BV898_08492 [Hypsibius exemplaris]|uniref:G-protein coupled receptors family 1 profile domain-containing protein n=1 Tax=Hypsibius exemplaris TaxID=2072580 RepID=A0A1W0WQG1_HYPEX|nr:hypothetical protein BV898_08492 [Hypsibius exemplaris]
MVFNWSSHGNLSNSSIGNIPHYDPMRLRSFVTFNLYVGALTVVLSILFNFYIILAFVRRPRLITSFTIQILNFVIIEFVTLIIEGPLNIATFLNPRLFTLKPFCAIYKFGAWTFPSLALLQQMAIGLDRWLALLAPVWYRQKTVAFGVKVTVGLCGSYFLLYLPLFIADVIHTSTVAVGARCDIHRVFVSYQIVVRMITYYLPLFFTYVSYPILLGMIRCRQRRIASSANTRTDKTSMFVTGKRADVDADLELSVTAVRAQTSRKAADRANARRSGNLSMWMMLVQIVCSAPLTVTYTLIQYHPNEAQIPYLHDFNSFSIMLTSLNMVVDPLIYWIFFRDLREETIRLARCRCFAS